MLKEKISLHNAYRIALARGMTAKQAGAEFGLNHSSISKMKSRLKLPSLISEFEFAKRKAFKSLTSEELQQYIKYLENTNNTKNNEYKYAKEEQHQRNIEKPS